MHIREFLCLALGFTILSLACSISTPAPRADPNAFNTLVAQTAQAQLTQLAPGQPVQPSAEVPTTMLPTAEPPPLSFNMSLPRHFAADLDTQTIWGDVSNRATLPNDIDIYFYAPNANQPDWQFLKTANNASIAYSGENQPTQQECSMKLSNSTDNLPLDSTFTFTKAYYACFRTDKGRTGFMRLTPTTPEYVGMPSVNIVFTFW